MLRCERVRQPFEPAFVDIEFGAEGDFVELTLGALIDDCPLVATKRGTIHIALDEILPDFGPDHLEEKAEQREKRVVSQDAVAGLGQMVDAKTGQAKEQGKSKNRDMIVINQKKTYDRAQYTDAECCKTMHHNPSIQMT